MAAFRSLRRKLLPFLPTGEQGRTLRDLALRQLGLARTYVPRQLIERPEWRAENLLKLAATEHLLLAGQLNVVQIGAFDGVIEDDIRSVVDLPGVRGVLVEPQPQAFAALQQTYHDHKNIELINAAVDRTSGTRTFYASAEGATTVASFDRDHVLRQGLRQRDIVGYETQCVTVEQIMQQANLPSLDLLQIDAEGYDYEILKSLDLSKVRPAIMRFEFVHFSRTDLNDCLELLAGHGYQFLHERKDLIAMLAIEHRQIDPSTKSTCGSAAA